MPESIDFNLLAGFILSVLLIASALLGWLGDMKRVGAATSARETTKKTKGATRTRSSSGGASGAKKRSASQEQEDRIREAYFAKERKAREYRERQRRQQQARQRARSTAGSASGASGRNRPPSTAPTSQEARYRLTLELKGPVTPQTLRASYRRLIAAYHPDRCATLGVKLQKLAEEETKRINEAYAYFRRTLK